MTTRRLGILLAIASTVVSIVILSESKEETV